MFKKLNLKTLLIIFGGLLVLVIIIQVFQRSGNERNFRDKLFEVDTAKVSAIILMPHGEKMETRIARNGNSWTCIAKNKTYKVDNNVVEGMLSILTRMNPERVAATDKSGWAQFNVTDTNSSARVKVEQDGKLVADFLVGKPSFQSQYKQSTYVRVFNEDEVYAVDGFLAMYFNKSLNDLRNKVLANVNPADITRLMFTYPADSSFALSKDNKTWKINGEQVDSVKVANYLNNFANLSGYSFVDDAAIQGNRAFQVKVEGKNFLPVEVTAFATDTINKYMVTSNMNPDARFSDAKDHLTSRIFVGAGHFKSTPVKTEKKK